MRTLSNPISFLGLNPQPVPPVSAVQQQAGSQAVQFGLKTLSFAGQHQSYSLTHPNNGPRRLDILA